MNSTLSFSVGIGSPAQRLTAAFITLLVLTCQSMTAGVPRAVTYSVADPKGQTVRLRLDSSTVTVTKLEGTRHLRRRTLPADRVTELLYDREPINYGATVGGVVSDMDLDWGEPSAAAIGLFGLTTGLAFLLWRRICGGHGGLICTPVLHRLMARMGAECCSWF